ncbi:2-oxo-4-hydroxy-4-carboxy-5-ureidoimidazoline decarboxylase [Demequina lignilytica]|uniref:2-oxo-4-hydroxy-4-carboxy-5-ureidoimidazoline decarboxylase n=1 Tax=Demequina lignilytica TaxID=3051663 RepID=A0AAW7MA13_9MICO|nr:MULTISPECIES: 2-oxo-4-hydroxy-4-carboxy-5-ureidoimidazoline decarboxylase [unclassified Demequina]MDN4478808.1 2-oxo-4-hydroxy-4-carboxy-5-ureidoimidazoline decarboxylase [Demequina sp. SYSU T00039-1]MDN4484093.1 2-oxo-4-hydroxy-4-carboxy-5-ureidoimidazoline decarboxylase [Demequina sp. SYSU T0a273]MDN4488906.1 2-oxo-4-hydroxy-4-carboxy-5-ureidoimidazoline decarboxylase [Demequina sp. SYSU T00039]MDN4490324.1 2-oxo-4-hydroxy-4-carboxy-5-ureidoimidazoline decarboxylase [Demequina sp. SYSU T00
MIEPTRNDLLTCLRVERWADTVASRAYGGMLELERAAVSAATPLTPTEIEEALAAHPRIGDRREGEDAEARFSRAEQASSESEDEALAAHLADLNALYEKRFGRVFLIRAAGRSRAEIVAELERRLGNDDVAELAEVADQLRGIALLRLRQIYGGES